MGYSPPAETAVPVSSNTSVSRGTSTSIDKGDRPLSLVGTSPDRSGSTSRTVAITQSPIPTRTTTKEDTGQNQEKGRKWYHPLELLGRMIDNWFLIGIGVSIVLAWRFPHVAADGGVIRSEYSIKYGAIALIFLITGLTLSTSSLYHQLLHWRLHLFTQSFCFLFFPAVVFAIVNIVNAAQSEESGEMGGSGINKFVLTGMVVMSVMPTTVASNIAMTRSSGGSTEAATMEVCVGNVIGTFLTPILCKLFFSSATWSFGQPIAKGGGSSSEGLKEIYRQLAKQLGLALFVPLFVGQVVQNLLPKQTKWAANTFRLAKVATFLLLLLIWSVFSTQFNEHAFEAVSTPSIIFMVFVNLALYALFTFICIFLTRLPFLSPNFARPPSTHAYAADMIIDNGPLSTSPSATALEAPSASLSKSDYHDSVVNGNDNMNLDGDGLDRDHGADHAAEGGEWRVPLWRRAVTSMRFDKKTATAICFCAAAKGMVVGAPTLSVLYGGFPEQEKAILSIPLVLYQGQQVAIAQILVYFFKKWNEKPDRLAVVQPIHDKGKGKDKTSDGNPQGVQTTGLPS